MKVREYKGISSFQSYDNKHNGCNGITKIIKEESNGSGLIEQNDKKIEYTYANNLDELINILSSTDEQGTAGTDNVHNDNLLVKFLHGRL